MKQQPAYSAKGKRPQTQRPEPRRLTGSQIWSNWSRYPSKHPQTAACATTYTTAVSGKHGVRLSPQLAISRVSTYPWSMPRRVTNRVCLLSGSHNKGKRSAFGFRACPGGTRSVQRPSLEHTRSHGHVGWAAARYLSLSYSPFLQTLEG